MSDFDLYILNKYLLLPLLVLCIPILWGPALQCATVNLNGSKIRLKQRILHSNPQGADPPPPLSTAKAGRNKLNQ
jgi:hypothetical protein